MKILTLILLVTSTEAVLPYHMYRPRAMQTPVVGMYNNYMREPEKPKPVVVGQSPIETQFGQSPMLQFDPYPFQKEEVC